MVIRESSAPASPRPERPRRGMRARLRRRATFGFSGRLCLAIGATFALLGTAGYLMIGDQLQRRLIDTYAGEHRADAQSFVDARLRSPSSFVAHRRIGDLLAAIARRPGVTEAILIDADGIVEAAGEPSIVGGGDVDPRIAAALRQGRTWIGHEADPKDDRRDFEFVMPVQLADGRHPFEGTRDPELLDSQLRDVRRTAMLLVVVGLFGAAIVFYLVGGRSLVRSHRIALRRASRDGLTDLPNQRAFGDDLAGEVRSAVRHGDALSVCSIDLDDFKFLNDPHGPPPGAAPLRRAAGALRQLRAGDRAYRVGGDEFAVILARTDAEGARAVARRLDGALRAAGVAPRLRGGPRGPPPP